MKNLSTIIRKAGRFIIFVMNEVEQGLTKKRLASFLFIFYGILLYCLDRTT